MSEDRFRECDVSIGRVHPNNADDYIQIRTIDRGSHIQHVTIQLTLAAFAEAVTGLGTRGTHCLRGLDRYGLKAETKRKVVPVPEDWPPVAARTREEEVELAALILAEFEVDGWSGRSEDLFNGHCKRDHGYEVVFDRWVPEDEEADS